VKILDMTRYLNKFKSIGLRNA